MAKYTKSMKGTISKWKNYWKTRRKMDIIDIKVCNKKLKNINRINRRS